MKVEHIFNRQEKLIDCKWYLMRREKTHIRLRLTNKAPKVIQQKVSFTRDDPFLAKVR